ncbi:unnamed protein product, partial [Allacma fusca]
MKLISRLKQPPN